MIILTIYLFLLLMLLWGGGALFFFLLYLGSNTTKSKSAGIPTLSFFMKNIESLLSLKVGSLRGASFFLCIFSIILMSNWGGLSPFGTHSFLGSLSMSIPIMSFFFWTFSYVIFSKFSWKCVFTSLTGEMKTPLLSLLLTHIELLTHAFRPITLSARLWVNLWVGHLLLEALSFLNFSIFGLGEDMWSSEGLPKVFSTLVTLGIVLVSQVGFLFFEVGITFLQTFVFSFLSKVYFEENSGSLLLAKSTMS